MKTETKNKMKSVSLVAGGLTLASLSLPGNTNAANLFSITPLGSGGELRAELSGPSFIQSLVNSTLGLRGIEAACGEKGKTEESKCGEKGKTKETKCGEEGKTKESKCGEKGKTKESKCGEPK
jgi:hypothetical protein